MPKTVRFAETADADAKAAPGHKPSVDPAEARRTTTGAGSVLPPDAIESAAWHQLFRHSPIGIGIYDRDGNCIRANARLAALVGGEVRDLLGQNLHRLPSWQDSGIYALALRAMASGGSASALIRGTSSFGHPMMLSIDFSVLAGSDPAYLLLFARDLSDMRQLEEERREIQERFEMLFLNSMDGILLGRPDGTLTAANPAICAMLGMTEQEALALGRDRLLDTSDARLNDVISARRLSGRTRGEISMVRGDGSTFEVEVSSVLYPDRDGRMLSSSIVRDITERRRLEQQLKDSLQLLDRLAQRAPGMLYQYRQFPDGRAVCPFVSEGIRSVFELEPEQVRDDAGALWSRIHPDDLPAVRAAIDASARTLQPWRQEYRVVLPRQGVRWRLADAEPERMSDGGTLWHGFVTDITQRRRQEEQTHWLAYFDPLTSLPNRRLFIDRISQALAMARRSGQKGSLLFIDLDHFKRINDARGHAIGDTLLRQVAQRLDHLVRAQDTVARLGGDEFVVLVCDLGTDTDTATRAAVTVADKILCELRHPYMIEGTPYSSNGSIGITVFPKNNETVDDLLREADTAMYRAKSAGRDRIAFYEAAMQTEIEEALALENDLKHAIDRNELHLVAQGQFDIDGRLAGAELLLRWDHPVRGAIPPARFIPVAEESDLIVRIGEWVLIQCAQSLARLAAAGSPLTLSINVSPLQFRHAHFVENVAAILAETGAPADQLIFEVTETLLITDPDLAAARMAELADLGIRFSIDDFGTGYASMPYLKTLRLYELKIDRSYVQGLPDDANDTAIVKAIIAMARAFHLRVVAEGVETPAQAEFLLNTGCDAVQGFLFARPGPFGSWVEDRLDLLSTAPR